jgi:hypothetical protein
VSAIPPTFKQILNRLERIKKTKDGKTLSLGQIIDLAVGPKADIWHVRDETMLMRLDELLERFKKQEGKG